MKFIFSKLLHLTYLLPFFALVSCNLLAPLPEPVSVNNTIKGQLLNWTKGARVLQAEATSSQGTSLLAKGALNTDGTFQLSLPTTLTNDQGLFSLAGASCLQVSPSSIRLQNFFSLKSFFGIGNSTALVALGSNQGLHGWMYATEDGTISGSCPISGGTLSFALNLKAGWNQIALELPNETTIKYVTSSIPTDATWVYIPQATSSFIVSPVATFKIGEPIQLQVLDKNENEIKGVKWSLQGSSASISNDGVVTASKLGSFTVDANTPTENLTTGNLFTYGLEFNAGTFNTKTSALGTALFAKFLDENLVAPKQNLTLSITGPTGWNNNAPLEMSYPAGKVWTEKLSNIAVLDGPYTAHVSAGANLQSRESGQKPMSVQLLFQQLQSVLSKKLATFQVRPKVQTRAAQLFSSRASIDATQIMPESIIQWNNLSSSGFNMNYIALDANTKDITFDLYDPVSSQFIANQHLSSNYTTSVQYYGLNLKSNQAYQLISTTRSISFDVNDPSRINPYAQNQFNVFQNSKEITFIPVIQAINLDGGPQIGGVKLSITGANFTNDSSVKFGDITATSVSVISNSKIDVIVPASVSTGIVDVTVKNIQGESLVNTETKFEYLNIKEFSAPNNSNLIYSFSEIEPDNIGRLWFSRTGEIGFMTNTGNFTFFPLPSSSEVFGVNDMEFGLGAMWFTYNNKLVKVTDSGVFTVYPLTFTSNNLVIGYDNMIWISSPERKTIQRYDTNGNQVGEIISTAGIGKLVRGPDQSMWFIANNSSIGKVNPSNEVRIFTLPELGDPIGGNYSILNLVSDTNNSIWYTTMYAGVSKIGQIQANTSSKLVNNAPGVSELIFGKDNRFWYTLLNMGGGLEPILETFTTTGITKKYVVGALASQYGFETPTKVASSPGYTWYLRNNKIGVIQLNP